MAHPSHESASQHSGNSAPKSSYKGDRDPDTPLTDPPIPADAQKTLPPRGGDGDGDLVDEQ
jgi:hypothetical protein